MEITLPFNFEPRSYQLPLLQALDEGIKRAVCVWHRRSGKDKTYLNYMIKEMPNRIGTYYYFFPNYNQGRKIMWDGMDREGFKYMNHFPSEIIANKNNTEMKITTTFGSIFQIIGTDNIDTIVGTNPVGAVFSEYALQDPRAWDFIRPIMRENGGWSIFNFTPRGRNHGYKMANMARRNERWFYENLTVDKTLKDDGTRYITEKDIEEERADGMSETMIEQEFYCSFEAALQSCFFGDSLTRHKRTFSGFVGSLLLQKREKDYWIEKNRMGMLEFWRFPYYLNPDYEGRRWYGRYSIGSDVGEGVGETYSVAYVFDRFLQEFVCRMRSNKVDADEWGIRVFHLAKFYDDALICVERTGAGITTVKRLQNLGARQYTRITPGKSGKSNTKQYGWHETKQSKYELCGGLRTYFRTTKGKVYDNLLLEECSTYIKDEVDRLNPDSGFLGDCVIGAACGIEAANFGGHPRKLAAPKPMMQQLKEMMKEEDLQWVRL